MAMGEARQYARCPHHVRMIALVAGDGRRLVVWGIGATHAEATADLGEDAPRVDDCEEYEITEAQAEVVRRGDVSWPVVVPDPSYEDEEREVAVLCRAAFEFGVQCAISAMHKAEGGGES
jgi:hypothetical protein